MTGERPEPRSIDQRYLADILIALERLEAQVARLVEHATREAQAPRRRTRAKKETNA